MDSQLMFMHHSKRLSDREIEWTEMIVSIGKLSVNRWFSAILYQQVRNSVTDHMVCSVFHLVRNLIEYDTLMNALHTNSWNNASPQSRLGNGLQAVSTEGP